MQSSDNEGYLLDILECIEKIERYLAGVNFSAFESNSEKIDAVIRNVEVMGEAANNLTRGFRSANPQIEWRRIISTRNKLIHGYAGVDLEIIWSITQSDLPVLKAEIRKLLSDKSE